MSDKDKALLVKLFFMNNESVTVALRKFRLKKNVKTGKEPSTVVRLIKLVQRFEETGSNEDRNLPYCVGAAVAQWSRYWIMVGMS
ncbi:hypothetical protein TNCV_2737841 [Trichonephila clavipes]|nr:hypothetical protein TNCV_2737841 [Trichonephila clavipes]